MVATLTTTTRSRTLVDAGAILLVSCYELGHQPLSLASPLAFLRSAGYDPVAVDTSVEALDDTAIRAARVVAISVPMHTALRLGSRIAERIRGTNPDAHICFYGLYATLNADHLLSSGGDSVISGEYERPLLDLVQALDRGDPPSVPGVGTRHVPTEPVLERLPFVQPARDALPTLRQYAGLEHDGTIVQAGYVETTRGCHHTCLHCPVTPIYGGRFFVIPREIVLADIRAQVEAGARHITFGDPDFFNGPGHAMRICRALHEEFPGLTFDATIKIEHILQHRRLFPELGELGCVFVLSAVESLNDLVLAKLDKGHTRADISEAIAILDDAGIPMRPSLLPFTPWETLDSYLGLLRFFAERDLIPNVDPVHFSIRLLVPPGSALLADSAGTDWAGDLDAEAFTHRWDHPDPRMDTLQQTVAAIVERAATANEDARTTFARIWQAAHETAGATPPPPIPDPPSHRRPPPRLTESWFC